MACQCEYRSDECQTIAATHFGASYRHTVTADEEHHQQPEPHGGILADDMGLGKTLTSISLIACSLDRASHFAQETLSHADRDNGALPQSRATLVVVPSTREHSIVISQPKLPTNDTSRAYGVLD